ncbi:MAG: flagellar biosynthesis protein FlhB [Halanaerobiaceae bacterium]
MPDDAPGEKTEEPTPKRRREAREEGQVAKSQELNQAFTLLTGFLILFFLFGNVIFSLQQHMAEFLRFDNLPRMSPENFVNMTLENLMFLVQTALPIMGGVALAGLVINFVQVGPLLSLKAMQPKFSNIDPIKGFNNIFSLKTLMELAKSLLKAGGIVVIAFLYISQSWTKLVTMPDQGLKPALVGLAYLIFRIGISIIIYLIFLGVLDFAYQRWEYYRNLKMTKYEVKQERKEQEGDPQLKSRRKEKQRQMSLNRMMTAMEEADVVITNPTHIAVALKYELDEMEAPVLIAKGEGFIARKIKEKARELDVEIVEDKPLARTLNKTTEIGEQIPEDLYQAVAEILAFIYKNNRQI